MKPLKIMRVTPSLPEGVQRLAELAHNLYWCWNSEAVDLFRRLSDDLWEATYHNPVALLGKISQEKLIAAAGDDAFITQYERALRHYDDYLVPKDTWFKKKYAATHPDFLAAYFSMEFGLTECLQTYSGGLGLLAGDHLKSASDLGLPLVGVGLLYRNGYFRQYLNQDGWQQDFLTPLDFYNQPLTPLKGADGEPFTVEVPDGRVNYRAQVWRVLVGRVTVYLLDTNLSENSEAVRAITGQLYGGDQETRIRQEILLGIGGYRALLALGLKPTVCHMNEGHAAFLALEEIRQLMVEGKLGFEEARVVARARNLFTTHTPVPAGIDKFDRKLLEQYLGGYGAEMRLPLGRLFELGHDPVEVNGHFNMAFFALNMAASRNGVSRLHGEISRRMFAANWPGALPDEVPLGHVTNGIHQRSWISDNMAALYFRYLGPGWITHPCSKEVWQRMNRIPAEELWRTHETRRGRLVSYARFKFRAQLESRSAPPAEVASADEVLRPETLTVGFARRFAAYKRANLLWRDPARLKRLLCDPDRPVQLILAGKAHPKDDSGKEIIKQIVHLQRDPELRQHLVFLEDYDIRAARHLVGGCDVWLNNPRRPLEASGTSGMKAAVNGVLNLSILDGWWDEAYATDLGWAIGQRELYDDPEVQDQIEANALYDLLEKEIVPLFYERGSDGLPREWIERMKRSVTALAPVYNTDRMVEEYCEHYYLTGHRRGNELAADGFRRGQRFHEWEQRLDAVWDQLKVIAVEMEERADYRVGQELTVRATLALGALTTEELQVELYSGRVTPEKELAGGARVRMEVERVESGRAFYRGTLTFAESGQFGFAVRVLPAHPDLANPFEPGLVLWAE